MTVPQSGGWESLDPWEKAAQWKEVAPEIAEELIRLAKSKAIHDRREQSRRSAEEETEAAFRRAEAAKAATRLHELDMKRVDRQAEESRSNQRMSAELLNLRKMIEKRFWWLQLVALVGGISAIGAILIVGYQLASSPTASGASLTIFGLGSSLAAGLLGANISVGRRIRSLAEQGRSERSEADDRDSSR